MKQSVCFLKKYAIKKKVRQFSETISVFKPAIGENQEHSTKNGNLRKKITLKRILMQLDEAFETWRQTRERNIMGADNFSGKALQ